MTREDSASLGRDGAVLRIGPRSTRRADSEMSPRTVAQLHRENRKPAVGHGHLNGAVARFDAGEQ